MTELDDLTKFRKDAVEPESKFLRRVDISGRVLAVDQSLSACGWVDLNVQPDVDGGFGKLDVVETGVISTTKGTGIDASLDRGTELMVELMRRIRKAHYVLLAHEMPAAVSRVRGTHKEAGPIAAMSVRGAAAVSSVSVVMLNVQHIRTELGLPKDASKKDTRAMVQEMIPGVDKRSDLRLNEATYDAMAVGLVAATKRG